MSKFLTLKGAEVDVSGAPEIITVLPLGHVSSQKGEFDVDRESYEAMVEQIANRGVDLVVDYEHQTLSGDQAPAAGWVKELILDAGEIKARVEWTPKARAYLENKEYRYLSPVITVRKMDNKAMGLHSLALTNTPAIKGMTPIVNSQHFDLGGQQTMEFLQKLAELFGLGADASEDQVLEAIQNCLAENKSLKDSAKGSEVVANKAVCELLGLKAGADMDSVTSKIMELKGGIVNGVNILQQLEELKKKDAQRDAAEAVTVALKAGKITPAQKDWALEYALTAPKGFAAFVAAAPQVVPFGEIVTEDDQQALKADKPDDMTLAVCKQMGIDPEDIVKYGKQEG